MVQSGNGNGSKDVNPKFKSELLTEARLSLGLAVP